uniref:Uncharacterized protein MANES_02G199100 n=1 Tax=Rhizophora mucronata TaxID=61149 RepID=A0A2P2LUN5_RHIMU
MNPSMEKIELEGSLSETSILIRLRATETPYTDLIESSLDDAAIEWTSALAAPCFLQEKLTFEW